MTAAMSASWTSGLFQSPNGSRTTPSARMACAQSRVFAMNSPGNTCVHSRPEFSIARCSGRCGASIGSSSARLGSL